MMQARQENRVLCFERDKGRCRACYTQDLRLECADPFLVAHAHHIVYRSRGGKDDLSNLCILCAICHESQHQKRLSITGNPNGTLVFREYAKWTRELLRKWESAL